MKRKFFQILLMGAVTVTLGMFVSCKDTSGDWYEEFNGKFADNITLQQAMQQHQKDIADLMTEIGKLQHLIDSVQCKCDKDLMQKLKKFMDDMNAANLTPADLKNMKDLLDEIGPNYQTILNFVTNVGVTKSELDSAMNVLRGEMSGLGGGCDCDLSRIDSIEKKAIQALNLAQDACNRLEKTDSIAKAAAVAAKNAADAAQAAADAAKAAGDAAQAAADSAKVAGDDAKQALADAAAADKKAQSALDLANDLKDIALAADSLSKANKGSIDQINIKITNINSRFVSISDSLQSVYKYADSILVIADANKKAIELLDSTVKADKAILDELKDKTIPAINTRIDSLSQVVGGLTEKVNKLGDDLTNLSTAFYNKVDSLGTEIDNLRPEITKLYAYADANLDKAKAYTDLEIALLRAEINGMEIDLEPLRKELADSIFNLREDMNDAITELSNALKDSVANLNERISENTLKIGEVDHKLDSIAENFKDSIAKLRSDLSDLEKRVKKNEDDIKDIFGQLENLKENLKRMVTGIIVQGTVNPAFGTLSLPVNVQSNVLLTYYGEATTDIQFPTNSTANYVDDSYVLSWKDLSMLGLNGSEPIFKAGDMIMQNDYYNAGTLYLTVNPNTVDFSKLQLSLVNSQEEESYVKLGELKRSDKVLQFGYSRAADNGFYECYANVAPEDVKKVQTINADASGLKDDIKGLFESRQSVSLRDLAVDFAELVKSFKLDANAVKCEWEDADGQKHAVYSNYNVAATAFKPLSLTSYKDLDFKKVPGYNQVVKYINKAANKIKNDIHVVMWDAYGQPVVKKIQNLTINKINFEDLVDLEDFNISKKVEIDGSEYTLGFENVTAAIKWVDGDFDLSTYNVKGTCLVISSTNKATLVVPVKKNDGSIVGYGAIPAGDVTTKTSSTPNAVDVVIFNQTITVKKDGTTSIKLSEIANFDALTVTVKVDMRDKVQELLEGYQEEFDSAGGPNYTLDQVKAIVKDLNNMLDQWNHYEDRLDGMVDSYKDKVMTIVNKYNSKLVNFINNINLRLQPMMFATDANGSKWLSEAEEYPTVLGQNVDLIATSWSLELLAPLAKKHVGITNVINGDKSAKNDDSTCLAELKRVNGLEKLNEVIPGDIMRLTATDLKPGYVYEIAYSGLDFHGKIATRKYYIKIK